MATIPDWYGQRPAGAGEWMRYADAVLGFQYIRDEQDWGLSNQDSRRVLEFLDFFDAHPLFEDAYKGWVVELILSSFNDALADGLAPEPVQNRVRDFLRREWRREYTLEQLKFFQELDDCPPEDPNPIGKWLQGLTQSDPYSYPAI